MRSARKRLGPQECEVLAVFHDIHTIHPVILSWESQSHIQFCRGNIQSTFKRVIDDHHLISACLQQSTIQWMTKER